jgi:hypothetical protein
MPMSQMDVRRDAEKRYESWSRMQGRHNENVGLPYLRGKVDAETAGNVRLEQERQRGAMGLEGERGANALRLQEVMSRGQLQERELANQGMLRNTEVSGALEMQRGRVGMLGDMMKSLIDSGYDPKSVQEAFGPSLRELMESAGGGAAGGAAGGAVGGAPAAGGGGYVRTFNEDGSVKRTYRTPEQTVERYGGGGAGAGVGGVDMGGVKLGELGRLQSQGKGGLRKDQVLGEMAGVQEKIAELQGMGYSPEQMMQVLKEYRAQYQHLKSLLGTGGGGAGGVAVGGASAAGVSGGALPGRVVQSGQGKEPWESYANR